MHKVILGFDFGLKRIGVAVGQSITQTANPLTVLNANRGVPNWADVKKIIDEWGVDALIVGLPLNMDGTEQFITQQAKLFGEQLKKQFNLPVIFVDERLTTIAAKEEMHATRKGAARFERADSVSAKLILESWFNLTDNG
jgi:putative holliday junction resolvase